MQEGETLLLGFLSFVGRPGSRRQAPSSACDFGGTGTGAGLPPLSSDPTRSSKCFRRMSTQAQRSTTCSALLHHEFRAECRSGHDLELRVSVLGTWRPIEKISVVVAARLACAHRPCLRRRATEPTSEDHRRQHLPVLVGRFGPMPRKRSRVCICSERFSQRVL